MAAVDELENRINTLMQEVTALRAKTNLEAVQKKIDAHQDEIRLLHRGFLVTIQEMIAGLNAEGVKRYEGAVKAVNDNSNNRAQELKLYLDNLLTELKEIKEKLNKFSMMV